MAFLFGRQYPRDELLQKAGSISQIGGVRRFVLSEGKEAGVEAIEFKTGSGLSFTVLPSRGMDISSADFCGRSLCWRSATTDVSPAYYEEPGFGWLRSFFGGLVVTCGLTYAGAPCEDQGKKLGLHGRASNTPARNVCADGEWDGDDYIMWARGKVHETTVFGENLCLTREIKAKLGESRLFIHDSVENLGYNTTEHMFLYHINIGFPVIDEASELLTASMKVDPRDADAEVEKEKYATFLPPTPGFRERVYYHEVAPDAEGYCLAAVVNRKFDGGKGFGVYVKYPKAELPYLIEWKMAGQGVYVMGVEPANCHVEGRAKDRADGRLAFLKPGEAREYHIEIGVLDGSEMISRVEEAIKRSL
ncbi:MAG: aldose 1-epimerase family protein [Firmicutes bacterium]|nr:aldose 1-epimerase family protein [Bacillota bacterium]